MHQVKEKRKSCVVPEILTTVASTRIKQLYVVLFRKKMKENDGEIQRVQQQQQHGASEEKKRITMILSRRLV